MQLRELSMGDMDEIKVFFTSIFTKEPWNDDWSDENQLQAYIADLIGNRSALTLGLFADESLVGLSMGRVKHWYSGTEYCIDELCIKTEEQGKGLGTRFLKEIESFIKTKGAKYIFLQTERTVPAYEFYRKNGFIELENSVSFVKEFE